jgi:hypothetical protein
MPFSARNLLILFAALVLTVPVCRPAHAQSGPDELAIAVQGSGYGMAEVGDDGGEVQMFESGMELSYSYFTLSVDHLAFGFKDKDKLPFGNGKDDPWEGLTSIGLHGDYHDAFDESWGWFVGGGVGAGFEQELDNSLEGMAYAGVSYAFTPELMVQLGVGCSLDAVEVGVLPLVGLAWRSPGDLGFSASLGMPETSAQYRFGDDLAVRLGLGMTGGLYRLADDSPVAREGYLKLQGYKAGLYVDWSPFSNLSMSFGPECAFGNTFNIYDKDGDKLDDYDQDAAFGGMFSLKYAF